MHTVSFAINYWSRGQVQGLFLRHEGYLGAIGAFLKGAQECGSSIYSDKYQNLLWLIIVSCADLKIITISYQDQILSSIRILWLMNLLIGDLIAVNFPIHKRKNHLISKMIVFKLRHSDCIWNIFIYFCIVFINHLVLVDWFLLYAIVFQRFWF